MNDNTGIIKIIAKELKLGIKNVEAVVNLFDQEATVPFIARYRKEMTGGLDETQIISIRDRNVYFRELEKRKQYILKKISEKDSLTPELEKLITDSASSDEIEELYLPYKTAKKTRAKIAEEKGLKPGADGIMDCIIADPEKEALKYIDKEKGLFSTGEVLEGFIDIIAGRINENVELRSSLLDFFRREAYIETDIPEKKKDAGIKYRDYFEYREKACKMPAHRIHAVLRGKAEKILSLSVAADTEKTLFMIKRIIYKNRSYSRPAENLMDRAVSECASRLLFPSMGNLIISELRERADTFAADVFARNLKDLLLEPPLGSKAVLAVDPGIRTGNKVVCLDSSGTLLGCTVLYINNKKGLDIIKGFIDKYNIEAAAVGNGTGSREAYNFIKEELKDYSIPVSIVSESGASVYSASKAAGREFAGIDITFRGAVSIGRRFQDPLSELIKIDPRAIGVGQYQHDVNQKRLKTSLDDVVISCVNSVGVELNRAGVELLSYVSGLNASLAEKITAFRKENGSFKTKEELLAVKGLGKAVYQQAAGFLRIQNGANPLDRSAVHPEHYYVAEKIAGDLGIDLVKLVGFRGLSRLVEPDKYIDSTAGIFTVSDIIAELEKPGRDPREEFSQFSFSEDINTVDDLKPGMVVNGTVTNITAFGAFTDIGVHQDGLIHISMISDNYVANPSDFLKVGQKIKVKVIDIDRSRNRISLSLRDV